MRVYMHTCIIPRLQVQLFFFYVSVGVMRVYMHTCIIPRLQVFKFVVLMCTHTTQSHSHTYIRASRFLDCLLASLFRLSLLSSFVAVATAAAASATANYNTIHLNNHTFLSVCFNFLLGRLSPCSRPPQFSPPQRSLPTRAVHLRNPFQRTRCRA